MKKIILSSFFAISIFASAATANMGSLKRLDSNGGLVCVAAIGVATIGIVTYDRF